VDESETGSANFFARNPLALAALALRFRATWKGGVTGEALRAEASGARFRDDLADVSFVASSG